MIASKSIESLRPEIQPHVISFIALGELRLSAQFGVPCKIKLLYTYRDNEYQDMLYAKGRTAAGPKVTNAKGGDSWHNYRCAWDVAVLVEGEVTWDKRYYRVLGEVAKELGIVWGGDWDGDGVADKEDWDLCHFQMTGGLTLAQLKSGQEPVIA